MPPPVTTLALRPPSGQALDLAGPWMPRPVTAVAKLTHADGAVYEGETLDGLRHGSGTFTSPSGDTYTGSWRLNERDGRGKARTAGGQTYEGAWRDGAPHGAGVASYECGGRYEGSWARGVRSGWGEHVYGGAGGSYVGQWADDVPHGQGVQLTPDGGRYEGTFSTGALSKGRWIAPGGGEEYDGEWEPSTGLRAGRGVRVLRGISTYSGHFVDDAPAGPGRCEYADGTVYEGAWAGGLRSGQGKATFPDGSTYEGAWADDAPHGKGRATVGPPSGGGGWYEGDWVSGARHGQGRERTAGGEVYAGGWVKGVRAGVGTAKTAAGEVYAGEWADGKRHGLGEVLWAPASGGGTWRGRWVEGRWVATPPAAPRCEVRGPGLARATAGATARLTLITRDKAGQACLVGGAAVAGWLVPGPLLTAAAAGEVVAGGGGRPPSSSLPGALALAFEDAGDGTYALSYTPSLAGEACLVLALGGALLADAPYAVLVSPGPPTARACRACLEGGAGEAGGEAEDSAAALVTAWVDVWDAHGNVADPDAAVAATEGVLRLGGCALPAEVAACPRGGVFIRVPPPLPGQGVPGGARLPTGACAAAFLEVKVGGQHVPGTPLAVGVVRSAPSPQPAPVPDEGRAWAARAAAALADLSEEEEEEGEDKDTAAAPADGGALARPLDPATAAYAASHPGVPVVEDLADLWLVGKLQREREARAKQQQRALPPEEVALARAEMAAKVAAEGSGGGRVNDE